MIDVGDKPATKRRAEAEGTIRLAESAFIALRDGKNPKGNVLALAEVAGIMAAKRTADSIPLCHPLPLDYARVRFELQHSTFVIRAYCEVGTIAKTGVEMEALAGVNGALLTIYDLSKAVDPVLKISEIRLNFKEGGKSGMWRHPEYQPVEAAPTPAVQSAHQLHSARAAVITVSDRASRNEAEDLSGPLLAGLLKEHGADIFSRALVPDEIPQIQKAITAAVEQNAAIVILTGGTGLSPRDVTPEALLEISDRVIPGFAELLRTDGALHIRTAWLSRSVACIVGRTLVIALPGSRNAVREGVAALLPLLPHALHTLQGGDHKS